MDTTGEGTDVTTGIDGEYSCLVKRMITVCGVCCTFKCYRIMYNSLFTIMSSLVKEIIENYTNEIKSQSVFLYLNLIILFCDVRL